MIMNLALFDFDGTISDRDSFLLFIQKTVGTFRFSAGMAGMAPQIILFFLKKYSNHRLKEDVLVRFFSRCSCVEFNREAARFCSHTIPVILRPKAVERINEHRSKGDKVVVVSASPELILAPWCREQGLELLGTRMQVVESRLTGRIDGENCRGQEKVRRICQQYNPGDYEKIYAYGDTEGDRPMLAMADYSFYRPFA